MNSPKATISRILPFSCVDGPGNRMVLFLQGCNFACKACHNPHTMRLCDHCGACIPACSKDALTLEAGRVRFDPVRCDRCDACLDACPIHANPMVGIYDVEAVLAMVRRNRPFLDGITVSGGEATTQLKFVAALFRTVKADPDLAGLTCFIDSNGHLAPSGWQKVLPWTDGVLLDVKAFDPDTHRTLTGADNARVLASARLLHAAGKLAELRFLVVPGYTDTDGEIAALGRFARSLGPDVPLRLNAFRTHGVVGEAQDWPTASRESVEAIAARLAGQGVRDVATPVVWC